MTVPPVEEQLAQLQSPVDQFWWLAQMERGIEVSNLERQPRFGSGQVLDVLADVYEPPKNERLRGVVKPIDVTITVGGVDE